jgi:hypothetical protein
MPGDDSRARGGSEASGSAHDDLLPGGTAEPRQPYVGRRAAPRSPSGGSYSDDPYGDPDWQDASRGRSSSRGREHPSSRRREQPVSRDREQPFSRGRGREQPQQPASDWAAADQPPSWQPGNRASGWPESGRQRGWPRGEPPEHGPDYPAASVPRQAPAPSDQAGWPEEGDSLEALPPIADVHHDWTGSQDKTRRNWLAPDDETDGDTW